MDKEERYAKEARAKLRAAAYELGEAEWRLSICDEYTLRAQVSAVHTLLDALITDPRASGE